MTPDEAEELLKLIGADRIKRASSGDFLHFRCPFAPFKAEHAHQNDQKPSAWVACSGATRFGCWTCTPNTLTLPDAVEHLNILAKGRFNKAVERARKLATNAGHKVVRKIYLPPDVTTDYTENFELHNQLPTEFLNEKGVTKASTTKAFRTGIDKTRGLVMFPIIDRNQVVVGAQARQFVNPSKTGGKYFSYYANTSKSHHLFGEHLLTLSRKITPSGRPDWTFTGKAIVVFEGPLDCMHAYDVGLRNVVALMGSKVSVEQMKMLMELVEDKKVYFVLDPDAAGRAGARASVNELCLDLAPQMDVYLCEAPADPKKLTIDDFITLFNKDIEQWRKRTTKELLQELLRAGKRRPPSASKS